MRISSLTIRSPAQSVSLLKFPRDFGEVTTLIPSSILPGFNRLFKTGDFVRIGTKAGRRTLFYEGRSDSQVKVRGQRVDLNEIESVLNSQADLISRAFVLCYNPGKEDQVRKSKCCTISKKFKC